MLKAVLEEMDRNNSAKNALKSNQRSLPCSFSASGTNHDYVQDAIDNRIEQALDLVKCHLMNTVLSEVEELKEKINKLEETVSQQQLELAKKHSDFDQEVEKLQTENEFLRNHVGPEVINQLPNLQVNTSVNKLQQN